MYADKVAEKFFFPVAFLLKAKMHKEDIKRKS